MDSNILLDEHYCSSCEKPQINLFCEHCGERKLDPKQRSLTLLLSDLFEGFISLENRLTKSLRSFFLIPGELSLNYRLGKRIQFMKPITFFLMVNLLYVLLTPMNDFNVSFYDQMNSQPYSDIIKPVALQLIDYFQLEYKAVDSKYQEVTAVLSRSLIIISAPLLAMFVALIYRNRNLVFVDHLVFSIYLYAWIMIWIVLAQVPTFLLLSANSILNFDFINELIYFDILQIGILVYILLSSRRAMQLTWLGSLLRLPLCFASVLLSHFLYRLIQVVMALGVVLLELDI